MKLAIIGFGLEGRAAYNYWRAGNEITVCDQNTSLQLPNDVNSRLGETYLADLDSFDLIVRSPHVNPKAIIKANSSAITDKVTTNTNEFLRICPSPNIIGVTGTKGKGTTSTLITKMLEASSKRVHLGGNIGLPALDLLNQNIQPEDWIVLELSSFQLIDIKSSPHIALCVMVAPEHLNWHQDLTEYLSAKTNLFRFQTAQDIAIYFGSNELSKQIASVGHGRKIAYGSDQGADIENNTIVIAGQVICQTHELKLLGQHNWQNVCAAVTAVWQVSQDIDAIRSVLTTFSGLPHRLELVHELDGVRYYDDSFGTTPETAIVALQAFDAPKVIILGGSDKGADYADLARVVSNSNVRKALLIGDQASKIQESLEKAGFHNFIAGGDNMTVIVKKARASAKHGDVVLLSTGCASFDMFENYQDRGDQFKAVVRSI